jgi:hypothetical protein
MSPNGASYVRAPRLSVSGLQFLSIASVYILDFISRFFCFVLINLASYFLAFFFFFLLNYLGITTFAI